MTEKEAREKWCPAARRPVVLTEKLQVRVVQPDDPLMGDEQRAANLCLGRKCALWIWSTCHPDPTEYDHGRCGLGRYTA